jgi:6-pyruvoyltetrahydropterin/6-carboxytetrahydropterin synthase
MKKKGETFVIRVEARFEAAHNLRQYYGKPEPLHGHSWRIEARIESAGLDQEAISIDYVKVKDALEALAKKLDYTYINEVPPFTRVNPSSENIARWFFEGLNRRGLLGKSVLAEVTLWEGPFNSLTYSKRRPR